MWLAAGRGQRRGRCAGWTRWSAPSGACTSGGCPPCSARCGSNGWAMVRPAWRACIRWMRNSTCRPGSTRWECAALPPNRPPRRPLRPQCRPEAEEASSSILALSADGKGVVMLPRDLREPTRKAAQGRAHKLTKRLSKGEKRNRKRMATVAAVYTVAPYERTPEQVIRSLAPLHEPAPARPPVEHKRVWASLEKTPEEVLEEAFREGLRRDPGRQKTWVGLVDGNATQLELLEALSRRHKVELTIVLDVMHVSEYLWDASVAFHEEASPQREQWVGERLHNVLRGNAAKVAAGMRRSATLRGLSAEQREPVDASARYLLNHQQYMRYDRYLAAGLPIGTGVIEGACRHLVCDRMDGAARWSLKGAEAVLRLRALRSSGDFEQYWSFHVAQEYQRNHVAHYANGNVVPVQGHSHPALRLVK